MNQTLKIAIPVAALMAVIFGVTFFAQYTPKDEGEEGKDGAGGGNEPPLRFFSSERHWDPYGSLQHRAFPGFYERRADAGVANGAGFWFENRNPKAVRMQIKGVSCSSCSGARVAPVPPAAAREMLQLAAVGALPQGLFAGLPLGFAGSARHLGEDQLKWQAYTFKENPRAEYFVPPADNPDGWAPQWGILELRFSVAGGENQKTLKAEFATQVEGSRQVVPADFTLSYEGVDPFNLSRDRIDVGEVGEDADPREFEVLVYSSTRGPGAAPGDLPPPTVRVQLAAGAVGELGGFVQVLPKGADERPAPVRVPEAELPAVAAAVSAQAKRPVRVLSAYRFTVFVAPKSGDRRADLGPLERDVFVSYPDQGKGVLVRGTVRGGVALDNGLREINVGNYLFSGGTGNLPYTVLTDDPAAVLERVPDPATPDFLQLDLKKQPASAGRGTHTLTVTVPPNKKPGPWAGFVVLELKGPKPQRIRIPIRGNGTQQ